MPETSALTADLLARVRPGAAVAVALGAALGIQRKRPSGHYLASARSQASSAPRSRSAGAPTGGGVAVVEIRGALEQRESDTPCGQTCGYDGIERDIRAAVTDPGVSALVVDIDSPGGDEPGLDEGTVRMAKAIADAGKPVLVYSPSMLASAAVYLALGIATGGVFIHPSARAGSVSSVVIFATQARKLAEAGTDVYVARGLPGKFDPNGVEPLSDLGKARLDEHARACSEDFVLFVAAKLGIDPGVVRSWNADMFRGQAAVDVGLVAGLGTLDSVIAHAATLATLGAP